MSADMANKDVVRQSMDLQKIKENKEALEEEKKELVDWKKESEELAAKRQ